MEIKTSKIYTGIGSRQTPREVLQKMHMLAIDLANMGWTLRSGGASGADIVFERACDIVSGKKEIYLPWKGFNGSISPLWKLSKQAFDLASTIHPTWNELLYGVKKLHARNIFQVLGAELDIPSEFLVCWTLNGEEKGGTRTAIVLAKLYNIPVFNLFFPDAEERLRTSYVLRWKT